MGPSGRRLGFCHFAAGFGPVFRSGRHNGRVGDYAGIFAPAHCPWLRRLVTMLPSLSVIAVGVDPTRTLVISQVGRKPTPRAVAVGAGR